jgi:2-methylaconitate cis-trans-isomerase PrpF
MGFRQSGQHVVPCLFMRGGSSRGGFFLAEDLPSDPHERAAWLLAAYGSPDTRQIDGIGGADALTSKAAVIAKSLQPGADVDYTFCQVGIDKAQVSTGGSCGNMLSAVGPYAIYKGLVAPTPGATVVRIYTTNTKQTVTAYVPMDGDLPAVDGDCKIAGVPSAGAQIMLDFGDCSGAMTGKLLPTGSARDTITIDGRTVEVSLVDAATPFVFVRAADVGAMGTENPTEIAANADLMRRLEQARSWAAVVVGRVQDASEATEKSPNVPRVIMVAPPTEYTAMDGRIVSQDMVDLNVRQLAMQKPHKALAVVGSVCSAVASAIEGSVVNECKRAGTTGQTRLGHPSGVLQVESTVMRRSDGSYEIRQAKIERTARLLMSGDLYLSAKRIAALKKIVTL